MGKPSSELGMLRWLVAAISLAGIVLGTCAQSSSASRVALIGSELSESGEVALGLAEVAVSSRGDVELLDRSMIRKVLQEHDLLADGFARPDDAVLLGKLLAVDVFVHVESIPEQKALAVVAFETAQGIRLLDEVIAGGNASELSEKLAVGIDRALTKWRAPVGQSTAISLMSVRNVDLPRSRNAECDSLGALLECRLLGSPDVVVVERKRLQSLNRDHEITMDRPENRLLSAPVLLDLDVSQGGAEDELQATAFLSDVQGAEMGSVRADPQALPALANDLCAKILKMLKAGNAPPPGNPALESARFFRTARFWKAQGRPDLTLAAAEAAYALDSGNPVMKILLINALFTAASSSLEEVRPDSLAYAARGMALLRQLTGVPTFPSPEQKKQNTMLGADNYSFLRKYGKAIGKSRKKNPFAEEEALTYAGFCQDWLAYSPFSSEAEIAPTGWELLLFVNCYSHYFPNPESAWRVLSLQVKRWSEGRIEKDPPHIPPGLLTWIISDGDSEKSPLSSDINRIRTDLWSFLEEHKNPLLRLYGRCGRIVDAARLNADGNWHKDTASQEFLNELYADLLLQDNSTGVSKEQIYTIADLTIKRSGHPGAWKNRRYERRQQQFVEMVALFRAMLKAGDVRTDVTRHIRNSLLNFNILGSRELGEEGLSILDAAITETFENLSAAFTSDELQDLKEFHEWVCEKREPGSTAVPPAADVRIEPIKLENFSGRFRGFSSLVAAGDSAYVLSTFKQPCQLLLQKWMPGSTDLLDLGVVNLEGPPCGMISAPTIGGVLDACLGENVLAAAVKGVGVFLFDRKSSSVEALHETSSLPLAHPLSVGILDSTLYVGTDNGYLVAFNLESRVGEVLVASSRKEKKSPFDDGSPVRISAIFPDPERARIVFVASVVDAEGNLGMAVSEMGGIWEYRPGVDAFKQLISYRHRASDVRWCEKVGEHAIIYSDIWGLVFQFDFSTDAVDLLSKGARGSTGVFEKELIRSIGLGQPRPEVIPVEQRKGGGAVPFLARGNWLWTAHPWGRISMKTYQWEKSQSFRMPDGKMYTPWPSVGMVQAGLNHILIADRLRLWLIIDDGEM